VEALGDRALPYRTVERWIEAFQRGREASADLQRGGRPVSVRTDVPRAVIAHWMEEDRRWSLKELERHTEIDQATVHRILQMCEIYIIF
jgi:transposase